jgi:methyl-accepting chemotaxis protein
MTIAKKIYITLIIGLFLGLLIKESLMDKQLQKSQKEFVKAQAQELSNYIMATREHYAKTSTKAHPSNEEIEKFYKQKSKHHFIIRTTSDKPVLTSNLADEFEIKSIKKFNKNRDLKEDFQIINTKVDEDTDMEYYHYTYALRIENRCIQCHINYDIGDTRGVLSIKIPKKPYDKDRIKLSNSSYLVTFAVMSVIFLALYYLVIKPLSINMLKLQNDLNLFFGYLNEEEEESHFEAIDTKDELGNMSKDIEKNIIKAKNMIKIQREYHDDLQDIINQQTQEIQSVSEKKDFFKENDL